MGLAQVLSIMYSQPESGRLTTLCMKTRTLEAPIIDHSHSQSTLTDHHPEHFQGGTFDCLQTKRPEIATRSSCILPDWAVSTGCKHQTQQTNAGISSRTGSSPQLMIHVDV